MNIPYSSQKDCVIDNRRIGRNHSPLIVAEMSGNHNQSFDRAVEILSADLHDTLVIVVADHGGGGVEATEHHHHHPLNERIPLVLAGSDVARRHRLTDPVSLLDVPATVLWWLGLPVPRVYEGRPLLEAFVPVLAFEAATG